MYNICQNPTHLKKFLIHMLDTPAIGFDTETTGLLVHRGRIAGWGIGTVAHQLYIPVRATPFALAQSGGMINMHPEEISEIFQGFFEKYQGFIVGHNIKFDFEMASLDFFKGEDMNKQALRFWKEKKFHDTKILAHLLDENRGMEGKGNALKPLCCSLLGHDTKEQDEVKMFLNKTRLQRKNDYLRQNWAVKQIAKNRYKWKPGKQEAEKKWVKNYNDNYADVPVSVLGKYCCADVWKTLEVFRVLSSQISAPYLKDVRECYRLERDIIPVICSMELKGQRVNHQYFLEKLTEYGAKVLKAEEKQWELAGKKWNVKAHQQFAQIMQSWGVRLPLGESSKKTGKVLPKTDKYTLEKIRNSVPPRAQALIDARLHYNHIEKLHTTYLQTMFKNSEGDRLYGEFNQTGTVTGRMSGSNPNLQNVPKKDKLIRSGFEPEEKTFAIYMDFNQMEMRLAAHFSQDPTLIDLLNRGICPYKYTAAMGEGIPIEDVTKEMRGQYKQVLLAALYGAGLSRLETMTGAAVQILDAFYKSFPRIKVLDNELQRQINMRGYINMVMGRRRRMTSRDAYKVLNSLIQGSGAMIVKKAMLRCADLLLPYKSHINLQVHDELKFNIYKDEVFLIPKLKEICEDFRTIVPLTVEVEYACPNWANKRRWEGADDAERNLQQVA